MDIAQSIPTLSSINGAFLDDQIRQAMIITGCKLIDPNMTNWEHSVVFRWPSALPVMVYSDRLVPDTSPQFEELGTPPRVMVSLIVAAEENGPVIRTVEFTALFPLQDVPTADSPTEECVPLAQWTSDDGVALQWDHNQPHVINDATIGTFIGFIQMALATC